ncbi:MAG: hypothetical protein DRI56_03935 [Chloroflexota bacterium]|nr:MAG: hypothetical protein DRI56_03935 [Chloroflexota bacterium]
MASILVIDDNYDMLEMLRIALSHRGGHRVSLCANGEDGLKLAKSERPDLAIVDVMMPDISGYEVVRQLRSEPQTEDMSIIILTARGQPVDKIAALDAGADLYMEKPVKPQDLLDEIEKLLSTPQKQIESGLFPVFSLRGGIGATTLAVNIALLFQQLNPSALIDFSTNSGHCASCLRLQPKRHWGMLLQTGITENQASTIGNLTMKHPSGLRLLAAPPLPLPADRLTGAHVNSILDVMQKKLRFLVVDMPPALSSASIAILEKSTKIILISSSDPLSIQSTRSTMESLKKYHDKFELLLNNITPGKQVSADKVEKTLRLPVTAQIPYHADALPNKLKGMPAVLSQPQSPFVSTLQQVIRTLLTQKRKTR